MPKARQLWNSGPKWENIGWKVDVFYRDIISQLRPADHMPLIRPRLPKLDAPLQTNGHGKQGVYLTSVPEDPMRVLADLMGHEVTNIMQMDPTVAPIGNYGTSVLDWEEHIRAELMADDAIEQPKKEQLIRLARPRRFPQKCATD